MKIRKKNSFRSLQLQRLIPANPKNFRLFAEAAKAVQQLASRPPPCAAHRHIVYLLYGAEVDRSLVSPCSCISSFILEMSEGMKSLFHQAAPSPVGPPLVATDILSRQTMDIIKLIISFLSAGDRLQLSMGTTS